MSATGGPAAQQQQVLTASSLAQYWKIRPATARASGAPFAAGWNFPSVEINVDSKWIEMYAYMDMGIFTFGNSDQDSRNLTQYLKYRVQKAKICIVTDSNKPFLSQTRNTNMITTVSD